LFSILACGIPSSGEGVATAIPVSPDAAIPTEPAKPTFLPPNSETLPAPTSEDTAASLNESGPWLAIITPDGLWAVNEDGSGLTRLTDQHVLAPQDTTVMAAPGGGKIAYITGKIQNYDLTLNIYNLPSGTTQTIPLIAPQYRPALNAVPGDPAFEAVRALYELTSNAWSPDGTKLAFMGVIDGPSSDLYVYDTADQSIAQLTDGPSQGTSPIWSPDGKYIVHLGVRTLGTGAGMAIDNIWAARADNGGVFDLYEIPLHSGDERVVGWLDAHTFLVHSWSPHCGKQNLRAYDVETGETQPYWKIPFNGVAVPPAAPGVGGAVWAGMILTLDQYTATCDGQQSPGIYLIPYDLSQPVSQITDAEAFIPVWDSQAHLAFARTPGDVWAIDPATGQAEILPAPEPFLPNGSPQRQMLWASHISGVWLIDADQLTLHVYDSPAFLSAWNAADSRMFFSTELGLFTTSAPDYELFLAAPDLIVGGLFWIEP
jgi:hypothetical protein